MASLESYDLASCPPKDNHVVIFSHYKYKNPRMTREGTHEDMNRLCEFFNYLQYTVHLYQDLTYDEIKKKLQHHSSPDHAPLGSLILVVMTHGSNDGLLWAHDREYKAHDIWEPFIDCPSLKDKPKVFVFQACRGDKEERCFTTDAGPDLEPLRLPRASGDVLLAYSTVEDYVSWRGEKDGSPYIQALCLELWAWPGGTVDLLTVLTRVTDRVVREKIGSGKMGQTPVFRSFLDKPVINTQNLPKSAEFRQSTALLEVEGRPSTSRDVPSTDQARGMMRTDKGMNTDGHVVVTNEPQYPMSQGGCALIYYDSNNFEQATTLQKVLLQCNFPVVKLSEISNDGSFTNQIVEEANSQRLENHSCLFVVALATLKEDQIQVSNTPVSTRDVTSQFVASSFEKLKHKPKIFFFVDPRNGMRTDAPSTSQDKLKTLTDHSDFLIVQATGEEFLSKLFPELQLCHQNQVSLIRTMTNVFKKAKQHGQHPNMESTLRRDVVFGSSGTEFDATPAQTSEKLKRDMDNTVTSYQFPKENFYGMKIEQHKFKEQLQLKKKNEIDIVVTGLPGVGKTEFVRKCLYEFENLRYQKVLWIDSSTKRSINLSIQKLKEQYQIQGDNNIAKIFNILLKEAKEHSIKGDKENIVIVFDNVLNIKDIEHLLPSCSIAQSFKVIVTSTNRDWQCDLKISLHYFTSEECQEFIQLNCAIEKCDEFKLVNMLWNCPSELQAAIKLIHEKCNLPGNNDSAIEHVTKSSGLTHVNNMGRKKILLNSIHRLEGFFKTIEKRMETLHTTGSIAMKILQYIAIIDENKISLDIIGALLKNDKQMQSALKFLNEISMISFEGNYIITEALIRHLMRLKVENSVELITQLIRVFKEDINDTKNVHAFSTEKYCRFVMNTFRYTITNDIFCEKMPNIVIAALNTTNAPHYERLKFLKENMDPLEMMIKKIDNSEEKYTILIHQYTQLLHSFNLFGKPLKTCIKFISKVPDVTNKNPLVLRILCFKAQALCKLGQWEEAWSIYIDVYARSRESFSDENDGTREHLVNICLPLAKLMRKHNKFIEQFQTYLNMWNERLCRIESDENATNELKAVCKAANILRENVCYDEVILLCDYIMEHIPEHFKDKQLVLGLQHHKTWSFNIRNISDTKWQECLELYKEQVSVLGMEHEDTKNSITNLGRASGRLDHYVERSKQRTSFLREVNKPWTTYLQLWTERFKIKKVAVEDLKCLRDTLQSLHDAELPKEVKSLCDHAMKHLPSHRSEEQHVLGMLHQKARSLRNKWQYKEAWSLWQDVYQRQVKALGMDHEDTRDTIMEMVETVARLERGNFKSYCDLWSVRFQHVTLVQLELLLETIKSIYSNSKLRLSLCDLAFSLIPDHLSEHRHTLQIMYWKCKSLYDLDRYRESWQLFQDLYWRQVRVLGMTHEDTMDTMKLMGWSAEDLDRWNIDRDAWRTYLELFKQMLEQPDIDIEYMFSLVDRNGYFNYQLQRCEVLVDVLKSSRGEKHHLTLRAQLEKARMLCCFERYDEAWQLYLDVCQLYGEQPQDRPDNQGNMGDIIDDLKRKIIKESDSEW